MTETKRQISNFWLSLPRPFMALAPMEDVTDSVFRRLVLQCGRPEVFFTEFTSVDGLFSAGSKVVGARLEYSEIERPLVAQLWGKRPENFYRASRLLVELGFDGIDINFGCPVPKVIKQGCCSAMIENWPLAEEIVLAAREGAGGLPLSIKTRLGLKRWATEEWTNFLLGLKPDVLTIHGRIAVEQSQQPANWGEIAKVVQLRNALGSSTLIIGNGDVGSRREANYKSEQYGVDGVMVGRGIFHDLFLFNSASETRPFMERSIEEKLSLLLQHLDMYLEVHGPESDVRPLKKFFKIYSAHFPRAPELRQRLVEADSAEAVRQIVHERLLEEK